MNLHVPSRIALISSILVVGFLLLGILALLASPQTHTRASDRHDGMVADDASRDCGIDWSYWHAVNPDVIGWIRIPNTGIDHPIVKAQADDPDFYLDHDVFRSWNPWGCPYLDADCTSLLDSRNVIIYGHNISTDETMFHDIANFHDEQYAREHEGIEILTPNRTITLETSGVATLDGSTAARRTSFDGDWDFVHYLASLERLADFTFRPLDPKRQLFTLCTCSYYENPANERTVVLAQVEEGETSCG